MKPFPLVPPLRVAAALLVANAALADSPAETFRFSDSSKPGTLKIHLSRGAVHIRGADQPDIAIESDVAPAQTKPRPDGLRVLSAASGYAFAEKDNVATLDYGSNAWQAAAFHVTVPRNTRVIVNNALGGEVTCSDLTGDIEIKSLGGAVHLDDVAGGALVETMNGEIRARIRQLPANRPLSFTSMNGAVVIQLPADAKANVRLRTQNGEILTDFDAQALVTRTDIPADHAASGPRVSADGDTDEGSARRAIDQAVQVAADAVRAGADAAKAGADAFRADAEAMRERESGLGPIPPLPPMPPMPSMTGGKIVAGILNGGGPEIAAATMNGDVTLRKAPPSPR
jgi:hypothetical protein